MYVYSIIYVSKMCMYIYIYVCFFCMYLCIYCIMPLLCTNDDYVTRMHLPLYIYILYNVYIYVYVYFTHTRIHMRREKDIREKGPRNLKSTHATYADNYINKNVYNVSKVNVMAYMHCMIPGQRKV